MRKRHWYPDDKLLNLLQSSKINFWFIIYQGQLSIIMEQLLGVYNMILYVE